MRTTPSHVWCAWLNNLAPVCASQTQKQEANMDNVTMQMTKLDVDAKTEPQQRPPSAPRPSTLVSEFFVFFSRTRTLLEFSVVVSRARKCFVVHSPRVFHGFFAPFRWQSKRTAMLSPKWSKRLLKSRKRLKARRQRGDLHRRRTKSFSRVFSPPCGRRRGNCGKKNSSF